MAEVPEALDAPGLHQFPGHGPSRSARGTQSTATSGWCSGAEFGQLGSAACTSHAAHAAPGRSRPGLLSNDGHQRDSRRRLGGKIAGYGAEPRRPVPMSTALSILFTVAKQQLADISAEQHIHMVADALLAETAEAVEILPDLCRLWCPSCRASSLEDILSRCRRHDSIGPKYSGSISAAA